MEVVAAGQKSLTVIYGRYRTVRLLHFAAALPLPSLTLNRQLALRESLAASSAARAPPRTRRAP